MSWLSPFKLMINWCSPVYCEGVWIKSLEVRIGRHPCLAVCSAPRLPPISHSSTIAHSLMPSFGMCRIALGLSTCPLKFLFAGELPSRKRGEDELARLFITSTLSLAFLQNFGPIKVPSVENSSSAIGISCLLRCCRMFLLLSTEGCANAFPTQHKAVWTAWRAL